MGDVLPMALRYILIAIGSTLGAFGYIDCTSVIPMADNILAWVGGIVSMATMGWGFYVKWNTKTVKETVAVQAVVPTVSAMTGATVQPL